MTLPRLVTSPGESYVDAMLGALAQASSFTLVTGFASTAGVNLLSSAVAGVLDRGGQGRIIVAVDRQGFNAAGVFRALLALRATHGNRLALGVALQTAGLLHAKALYTESPAGPSLLIGSANLTRTAYEKNHELGVVLESPPSEMCRSFKRFVDSVAARSLDGADAEAFLVSKGLMDATVAQRATPREREARAQSAIAVDQALARLAPMTPLVVDAEGHLVSWIRRGYIVGRGRRGLDALVLRVPRESLVRQGYLRPSARGDLGMSYHETTSMGFGVGLIPTKDSEQLRRDARGFSAISGASSVRVKTSGNTTVCLSKNDWWSSRKSAATLVANRISWARKMESIALVSWPIPSCFSSARKALSNAMTASS